MSAYDFTGLSPSDFEAMCRDLIACWLGVPIQVFVTGRDKGIDLRHAPIDGQDCIIQCKHFARSGYAKLRSHLARNELPKIQKLRPKRYILATSVGLSPTNVDDLFALLSPYCTSRHDIIGQDDLNALLRANPTVEQSHFKLWLTSEAVLSRVLHNDVFVQSLLTGNQIKQRLGRYVYTGSFEAARKKLEEERVCILSGVPGVGKTTMAEMLLVEYLMNDWELVSIIQNVTEGQTCFRSDPNAKQVFYYDDFLGQVTKGDKLGKNEDRALLQLIEAVARTRNKRFILTTREYILAQAKAEHEYLARSTIDLFRFVVNCEDYTDVDKARILANHLYFANVPQPHIAALIEKHFYRQIIGHRNYSPRVIEWMTNVTETSACSSKQYPEVFFERLENPSKLWTHAFEHQISEASRHVLLVLGSFGGPVFLADLQEAFDFFFLERSRRYGFTASPSSFRNALDELEGNFIRLERTETQLVVLFHNPSVLDFVQQRFLKHPKDSSDLLWCVKFFEQVERLLQILHAGIPKREQDTTKGKIAAGVVQEAISRTLLTRSIRLIRIDRPPGLWYRHRQRVWDRLRTCCRIGSQICDTNLRTALQEHIEKHVSAFDTSSGQVSEITLLLDEIERCGWLEPSVVGQWLEKTWKTLLALNGNFEEPLDGLVAIAEWFAGIRLSRNDKEAGQFVEDLASAVTREVEEQRGGHDPTRIGGDLAFVEEISKILGRDFSQEVQWLNEALAECSSFDGDDDIGLWREHRSHSCLSSIDTFFDALLE